MKIVEPLIEVEKYDGKQIMKKIERACRTCYRSEGSITDDSYKTLIKNCINRGHESVLEHEKITVRMTCDIGCYDKDTKVLTTNGWKYIKDIDVTLDKVYTMTNAGDIVVSPIMSKIEKEYEGNLYNFKNTIIDLAVTPDHNMWIFDTHKRSSQTKIWKFILAKDMNNKSYKFDRRIKPSVDKGVSIKEIPAVSYNNKEYPSIIIKDNNAFFELLGWFITDGSLEKQGNYIRCRISQTKKFGRERIEIILNKLDIDYSYSDKSFTIKCPQLNHFIYDNFYRDGETKKSLTMFVPDIIRNGYLNEIESFVKGVLGGNGYTKSTGTKIIYTASEKFAEDLVELLFKIGINANYHITPSLNKYEKSFKQNASVYVVSIHKNQSITWWDRNENNFNYIPYNDKVYCLELAEHHRLYIMRNGKTCWCGNCYKDLTRHRFGSFSIESTRFCNYGKDKFDNEIKFIKPVNIDDSSELYSNWIGTMDFIEKEYLAMSMNGATPDQMRMILPHSTASQVTMTANIREWKHILNLRTKKMTHPSIQQLLIPLLLKFKEDMPEIFDTVEYNEDFPKEKYAKLIIMED